MAIIIPVLMAATGATAGIASAIGLTAAIGASAAATVVSAVASVAFQVTGVNDKINKAASKVFGEDLVKVVNIAGAVYGAVNGGFDFGGGGVTDASSINAVNGMDAASDAFSLSNAADIAAGGSGLVSDGLGTLGGASAVTDPSSIWSVNGMDSASDSFNLANKAAGGGFASDGAGANLLKPEAAMNVDAKAVVDPAVSSTAQTGAAAPGAAAPITTAVTPNAPTTNASDLRAAARVAGPATVDSAAKGVTTVKPGSFFDKLLSSDKAMGAVIQGVGGALSSSAAAKSQKEALDFAKRKYHSVSGVRVA